MTPTYKATDSREIPDGWNVKALGEIVSLYQPQTISAKQFTEAGYPVYGANGVVGNYHSANHETWQVTVTCRGSTCGTVNRTVDQCWITGNAMVLNCDHNPTLDKEFLYQLMLGQDLTDCITGTGQPQIVRSPLAAFRIAFPIALNEQRAIATALSDVDALIAGLERLIAKKRDIKQAAMQQLLTGQTRLPGFSGEWDIAQLGDLLVRLSNGAVYRPGSRDDVMITRIETIANGTVDYTRVGFASWDDSLTPYTLKEGDILFSHINSVDHIGKVAIVPKDDRILFHGMNLLLMRAAPNCNPNFLFYWLRSEATRRHMRVLAKQAVSQASINTAELRVVPLSTPSLDEQTAISTVLSDMDAELTALESRLTKTLAIKQGMMQELLTGRTRLI